MNSIDLHAAAARITATPAPVFMLDTCAIIDLLRSPFLHTQKRWVPTSVVGAAQRLVDGARGTPRRSWLVATELVTNEFNEQLNQRCKDLDSHLNSLDNNIAHAIDVWGQIPNFPGHPFALKFFQSSNLSNSLRGLACNIIDSCLIIREDTQCKSNAGDRVILGKAPAAKGKQEFKDCHVVEHYLELSRLLSKVAGMRPAWMISSNINDYRLLPPKEDPELAQDFKDARLYFASDMSMALAKSPI